MNILVNSKKVKRAEEILAFVSGEVTKTEEQTKLRDRFVELIKEEKVKDEDRKEFIYRKLGGLVRTPEEHAVAEKKAKEVKEKRGKGKSREDDAV